VRHDIWPIIDQIYRRFRN